jgi:dihydrofolate reductase
MSKKKFMKVSVYIATGLDGYIARVDGDLDWLPDSDGESCGSESADEDLGFNAFMDSVDVVVMGRNTYEMVLATGQWPYGSRRVVVLSSKLSEIPEESPDTVELRSCSPAELVGDLLESGAKHLWVDGGRANQGFLNAGLIHKIAATGVPGLIGNGVPLFGPVDKDLKLRHVVTRSFANGLVQSRYEVCE